MDAFRMQPTLVFHNDHAFEIRPLPGMFLTHNP